MSFCINLSYQICIHDLYNRIKATIEFLSDQTNFSNCHLNTIPILHIHPINMKAAPKVMPPIHLH